MWKHVRNLTIIAVIALAGFAYYVTRPQVARVPESAVEGRIITITDPRPETFPTVSVARAVGWPANQQPTALPGLTVTRYAAGLAHPRNLYVLPNGDVLVAETNAPADRIGGIKGLIARYLFREAGADTPSANRIRLLRDSHGTGHPDLLTDFITQGLNSPFGMALIGDTLYVANTDAVVAYPYHTGETRITATPRLVMKLNALAPNYHWTRNLAASPDGRYLYIAIGSDSNIGENGLDKERGRARVLQYDLTTNKAITYSAGMRNPVGLAFGPDGVLWATVNERDQLGPDMVPDYLAQVQLGADYGWPWDYWGGYIDPRVPPPDFDKRQYERRPDYALGTHVAPLGMTYSKGETLGPAYASGMFIARHGSWNRVPLAGYDVVFVPFVNAMPTAKPVTVVSGFLNGHKAYGRPVGVAIDRTGALLVSDDVGNVIWRVAGTHS